MKKLSLVIVLALVVAIGFLLIAPGYIDWSKRKEQIVSQLNAATGLTFEITGDLELALLPFPRVMVEGLSISNPDHQGQMIVALEKAEASLALPPLFSGNIQVDSVSLIKPQITLEVGPEGEKSWMTGTLESKLGSSGEAGAEGDTGLAGAISLDEIKIKDGSFLYVNRQENQRYELGGIDLALRAKTIKGPFEAEGEFTYNGQTVTLDAETERLEEETLPLRAELEIPGLESTIAFSGVIATAGGQDIQGQIALETASLSRLAGFFGGAVDIPALNKPFNGKGMLTISPEAVALRDAELTLADIKASGKLVLEGLNTTGKPAKLDINIAASTPIDPQLFTAAASKAPSSGAPASAKSEAFIPVTLTLPLDLIATVNLAAPSLSVAEGSISDVTASLAFANRQAKGAVKGTLPGKGQLNLTYSLAYASSSRSEKTGAVTFSDPVLSYTLGVQAEEGAKTVAAFAPADKVRPFFPLVQGKLAARANGQVTPRLFSVAAGQFDVSGASALVEGSYALKEGRNKLEVGITTKGIDVDSWLDKFSPAPSATQQDTGAEGSIKAMTQRLLLPFDFELSLAAEDIRLGGSSYDRLNLMADQSGKTLVLEMLDLKDARGNSLLASGKIDDLQGLQGIALAVEGQTSNLKGLLAGFKVDTARFPDAVKTARLVGEIKGSAEKAAFTANLTAMNGTLDVTGVASNILQKPAFSGLTARIKHPNYTELAQIFKPDFRSTVAVSKGLDVFASMKREGKLYSFTDLQATIGPSTITGDLAVNRAEAKPMITADLKAGNLPLDKLLGHDADHKGSVRAQPLGQNETVRWSRNAFDTAWMHKVNFDIVLAADAFSYGPWVFNNAVLDADLKDGILTLNPAKGGLYGGQGNITAKAISSDKERIPLEANASATLTDIDLQSFIQSFSGSRLVRAEGNVSLDTQVSTTGLSPAALVFSLRGKGAANGNNLVFEGFDLAKLSSLLAQPSSSMTENLTALLDTSMQGGTTSFDTLTASYTISEGIIQFTELKLTGPDAVVTGKGAVNLPLWAIDMTMVITLNEPADAPPLTVSFKGPLDNPGQSFARTAMERYFQDMLAKEFKNVIGEQLGENGILPKLEKEGILPLLEGTGILPKSQKAPSSAPAPAPEPQPEQPEQPATGQVAPEPAPKEARPEDVFMGVLEGLLERQ